MSQLTTHVLDTAKGTPAQGLRIELYYEERQGSWREISSGTTNADGRIADFLADDLLLEHGVYRMHFDTAAYFRQAGTRGFYPYVDIVFEIVDSSHYHVPLLLSPYGYSTYRGS